LQAITNGQTVSALEKSININKNPVHFPTRKLQSSIEAKEYLYEIYRAIVSLVSLNAALCNVDFSSSFFQAIFR
jgi:hypothetical protein